MKARVNLFLLMLPIVMLSSNIVCAQKTNQKSDQKTKSGADREEGWIIRRTKDGIIKVPKKQVFNFKDGEISGQAQRPSQTVLGQQPTYRETTLIPERKSFMKEFYEDSGYSSSSKGRSKR